MAKRKRIQRSRAFWIDVVAEYQATGMSQAAFARDIKVNPTTLNNWITKLSRDGASESEPHFLEVVPAQPAEVPSAPTATRIVVRGVTVEFCDLPPVAYVAALLREVAA